MKNKIYKTITIIVLFIFFLSIPFLQSFIFASESEGKIDINKKIEASYINSDKKYVMLFFGYVGCTDVCTPFLQELSTIYDSKEFKPLRKNVDVVFVNLTPEIDKEQPDMFAKFFNPGFKGVYLSRGDILRIDRAFGLFFSRSMSEKTEVDHTDFLYLIKNTSELQVLKNMYTIHPFNKEKIIEDIIQLDMKNELL